MTAEERGARGPDVSRETAARLEIFAELLEKWNARINLVSRGSLGDLWRRHIWDSHQLHALAPEAAGSWVDLGSGGGFPGLVIAILEAERATPRSVTLIEADQRKAAFLRAVLRETGVQAEVRAERIETVPPLAADVVSARALAPLPELLGHVHRHLAPGGIALLPKGARAMEEVALARRRWAFDCKQHPSATDPSAVILKIGDLSHV